MSEDATGITPRVEYYSEKNINVGFVLPFDENGIPKTEYFKVSHLINRMAYISPYISDSSDDTKNQNKLP